ncbi:biotin--[acetyl-CoA-carboxylase] ligase [Desulfovibrio sp. TomC]|uniref:biotin--[acetyl-CoA-carboxylase] ligase n=1 Tax=Desulfovibrio sp. TomC TaxID=1562888 RepID=UPI0005752F9E|nr:biotin--[acetyl-CoA-carboxylase] ligase [Desulfovibrio sp. TomC]KHK01195.1 Biotin--protein ligase [Desulfovibrio sp. TomC]
MQNPFAGGGIWLRTSGDEALAGPISPENLASCHPLWAADVARLAPWREVELGPQYGPAAGRWLAALGPGAAAANAVLLVGPCTSSLDVAWELAGAGCLPPFASVVAVSQKQGRGQMRRNWISPPGNLYAALAWPGATGNLAAMAPVLVGACLSAALYDRGFPSRVKWPNDLLAGDRKIGGILLEERAGRIMAGIGINFASAPDAALLRRDHAAPAASLQVFGEVPGAVTLWSELVKSGQTCYLQCVALSDTNAVSRFVEQHLAWLGREVFVRESETDGFRARIIGLAEDGGLRLRHIDTGPGQDLTLHSGSISLL